MNPDSVPAQVPDISEGVSESTKASTTEVQTITSRKTKKTNAQKCREYRERKKLQSTMVQNITAERSDACSETDQLPAKKPKTDAERRRKYYAAQKLKKQKIKKIPKTAKQLRKECYYRKKKSQALNTFNHHSDASAKKREIEETSASNYGIEFVDVNIIDNSAQIDDKSNVLIKSVNIKTEYDPDNIQDHTYVTDDCGQDFIIENSAQIDDKSNVLIKSVNIKTEYDSDNIQDHTYVTDDCGQEFIIKTEIDIKEEMLYD